MTTSWKTTLAGVLTALPTIAHLLFPTVITVDVAAALTALFASLGLIASKDGNVTGGTVSNGQAPTK